MRSIRTVTALVAAVATLLLAFTFSGAQASPHVAARSLPHYQVSNFNRGKTSNTKFWFSATTPTYHAKGIKVQRARRGTNNFSGVRILSYQRNSGHTWQKITFPGKAGYCYRFMIPGNQWHSTTYHKIGCIVTV